RARLERHDDRAARDLRELPRELGEERDGGGAERVLARRVCLEQLRGVRGGELDLDERDVAATIAGLERFPVPRDRGRDAAKRVGDGAAAIADIAARLRRLRVAVERGELGV